MTGPLTYPPEIIIESTIDLPLEFGPSGADVAACGELAGLLMELVVELVITLLVGGS